MRGRTTWRWFPSSREHERAAERVSDEVAGMWGLPFKRKPPPRWAPACRCAGGNETAVPHLDIGGARDRRMILFPAIDLKEGVAVRLEQGDMTRATVFHRDPAAQARAFEMAGFQYLHIVDLDGAFAGKPVNADAVDRILESVSIPVQLGGGVRDMKTTEGWLSKGVTRVIIGTAAVRDSAFVKEAAKAFPGRVAVGLDARDGEVAVEGWVETSE